MCSLLHMDTTNTEIKSIHLQGIGQQIAKPAETIAVGDVLVWNYGCLSTVAAVRNVSPKFIEIDTTSDGKQYTRRLKKDRLVGWSPRLTADRVYPRPARRRQRDHIMSATKFLAIYRLTADIDEPTRNTIGAIDYPQTLDEVVETCRSLGVAATLTDEHGFTKGHVDADGAYRLV